MTFYVGGADLFHIVSIEPRRGLRVLGQERDALCGTPTRPHERLEPPHVNNLCPTCEAAYLVLTGQVIPPEEGKPDE